MDLLALIHRTPIPQPWEEGEKIPWNEPAFSRRMLQEHLSQAHDAASRRFAIIDKQVAWIHTHVLHEQPTRILDLGCGPGLYTQRLARLGHTCTGIDFSPASIEYAEAQATAAGLDCRYILSDIRTADYGARDGKPYRLVMSIFGEFNVFRPQDARTILRKAHTALEPGGALLLEPHTFDTVKALGNIPPSWYSSPSGLFSERPHLYLQESFWSEEHQATTDRYFIIDAETGAVTSHAATMQAYTDEEYRALLEACGFGKVTFHSALGEDRSVFQRGLMAILAQRA